MATLLKDLKLKEVSLVDNPANPHARVLLSKRVPDHECTGDNCQYCAGMKGKVKKTLAERLQALLAFGKRRQTAEAAADQGVAGTEDGDSVFKDISRSTPLEDALVLSVQSYLEGGQPADEVIKGIDTSLEQFRKAVVEAITDGEEPLAKQNTPITEHNMELKLDEVLKGLSPEAQTFLKAAQAREEEQQKTIQKLAGTVESLVEKQAERVRLDVAKGMVGETGTDVTELAHVLKQLDEAGQKTVEDILKQFGAVLTESELFVEKGHTGAAEDLAGEVQGEVAKAVAEVSKAFPKFTQEQALRKALEQNPELYELLEAEG